MKNNALKCDNPLIPGCTDGYVRLTEGSSRREGTVKVCSDRMWGLVSGLGCGEENARVVCKQLHIQAEGEFK